MQTIRAQIEPFLSFEGDNAAVMVNNLDWTAPMSAIDFLRDVGKHFRVNKMITKDAVAARLHSEQGISYTEFSYQLLQGLDFLELLPPVRLHPAVRRQRPVGQPHRRAGPHPPGRERAGARVRHAAADPCRRDQVQASEGAALWLDPGLTSPYAFFQFWLNTDDRDVVNYLKVLSFRSRDEIEALEKAVGERPQAREAQRALAEELTALVHGEAERDAVVAASQALFGRGELAGLDGGTLAASLAELPHGRGDARRRRSRCWSTCSPPPGWRPARARHDARWRRAARTSTTSGWSREDATPWRPRTCWRASGWCSGAASAASPRSASAAPDARADRPEHVCRMHGPADACRAAGAVLRPS